MAGRIWSVFANHPDLSFFYRTVRKDLTEFSEKKLGALSTCVFHPPTNLYAFPGQGPSCLEPFQEDPSWNEKGQELHPSEFQDLPGTARRSERPEDRKRMDGWKSEAAAVCSGEGKDGGLVLLGQLQHNQENH